LSNSLRVGAHQLPDLWSSHVNVCTTLDMPQTYDLYVTESIGANAIAVGAQNPIVVFGSPLLERLGPGEQRSVLAHEVAHILSDHMLYRMSPIHISEPTRLLSKSYAVFCLKKKKQNQ